MIDREQLREWYSSIGRRGGSATSAEKSRAARRNGARGGRPRRQAHDLRELLREEDLAQWLVGQGLARALLKDGTATAKGRSLAARLWQSQAIDGTESLGCWIIGWNGSEAPIVPIASRLPDILQASVPERYYLSPMACAGMLRRAGGGKGLPPPRLRKSLRLVAGISGTHGAPGTGDGKGVTASSGNIARCLLATGPRRRSPPFKTFVTDQDLKTRSLTPVEYERLQGFPDDFTRIPYGGRPAEECPDSLRYAAAGNSMAVPCLSWIGGRIRERCADGGESRAVSYIHIFSGISAACVAFRPLGWRSLAFSEIDPFALEVLRIRHPEASNVGNMTAHDWSQYRGQCNLIVGGPPCQAFSTNGFQDSLRDGRGSLTLHFARAIHAVRPEWVVAENVSGWLSTDDNAFGCFLAGLVGADAPLRPPNDHGSWPKCGVVSGPAYGAAWRVLDARHFGVPQSRRRVFVVGHLGDWRSAAGALFECAGGGFRELSAGLPPAA